MPVSAVEMNDLTEQIVHAKNQETAGNLWKEYLAYRAKDAAAKADADATAKADPSVPSTTDAANTATTRSTLGKIADGVKAGMKAATTTTKTNKNGASAVGATVAAVALTMFSMA